MIDSVFRRDNHKIKCRQENPPAFMYLFYLLYVSINFKYQSQGAFWLTTKFIRRLKIRKSLCKLNSHYYWNLVVHENDKWVYIATFRAFFKASGADFGGQCETTLWFLTEQWQRGPKDGVEPAQKNDVESHPTGQNEACR